MEDTSSSAELLLSGGTSRRKLITTAHLVFGYAVLASLWIIGSGFVSTILVVDPVFRNYVELAKGLFFVGATSGLLYVLLRAWRDPEVGTINEFKTAVQDKSTGILSVGVLGAVMLPMLSGYGVYLYHQSETRSDAFADLAAVAQLKTGQIERWLEERMGDGLVLSSNAGLIAAASRLGSGDDDRQAREFVKTRLNTLAAAYGYEALLVLNSAGEPIETLGDHAEVSDDLRRLIRESISGRRIVRRDLTREVSGDVHADWIVPLISPGSPASAVVVLRMSADQFLYPFIQAWPTSSKTAETLLVSGSGDMVHYLSGSRDRSIAPLSMVRPLADKTLPAAIAIGSGTSGETIGLGYRNHRVLASYRPVNGTTWYLIAKIDEAEIFGPLYQLAVVVGVVTFFSILGLSFIGILFWRQVRIAQRLELELRERNAERLQRMFFELPFVGMAAISPDNGKLLHFNDYFCAILSHSRESMAMKSWADVTASPEILPTGDELDEVGGAVVSNYPGFKRILRGDGVAIDASIDIRPIFKENGQTDYLIAMVQDVSARRRMERALADERNRLQEVIWGTGAGTWEWTVQTGAVVFNERWAEIVGYTLEELSPVSIETWRRLAHPDDLKISGDLLEKVFARELDFYECEARMWHKNGHWVWVADRGNVVDWGSDGKPLRMSGTHTDITRQKVAEEQIIRISELRDLVLRCQSLMLTASDEKNFLHNVAETLVDARGYELAWFGVPQDDGFKSIVPFARAGKAVAYLDSIEVHWSDDALSQGPGGKVAKTGQVQVLSDMATAASYGPWKEAAAKFGFRSSAAFPLIVGGNIFAVLMVYNSYSDAFDSDEVQLLSDLTVDIGTHLTIRRSEIEKNEIRLALDRASSGAINAIAATIEKRDPYTSGHQHRVAEMSVAIAQELGWAEVRIEGLRLGATIHDIGKIYVPAEILNRPGKLSPSEFAIIKSHPQVGFDILQHTDFPWPIKEMILQHHERIDGSGYPQGLKGDQIIDEAKVIAIADVLEAITSHRPYRPGLGLDVALAEIEAGRGSAYDPAIADTCLKLFRDKGYKIPL